MTAKGQAFPALDFAPLFRWYGSSVIVRSIATGTFLDTRVETELDLIGAIYDAVIDAARWDETVDRIRRYLGFHLSMLAVLGLPSGKMIVGAQSNVPYPFSETIYTYADEAMSLWGGVERFSRLPVEEPIVHTEANPSGSWIGSPFYEEWAKPQGLVDQVVLILESNSRLVANIAFGVHQSMSPIRDEQIRSARTLAPHLRRAAIISGLLDGRKEAAESFESVMNALGSAILLVDESLHIIYANPAAERMLDAGDPVKRFNDRLELRGELVRGQLQAAVSDAATDAAGLQHGSGIPVRRHDNSGLIVHLLPLRRRQPRTVRGVMTGGAVAAVFVAEPDEEPNLPLEAIRLLYGLRPAEARVFELIARGLSAPQIAQTLGTATSTAKTHTLHLFEKLGIHSRAELMHLARKSSL